MLFNTTMLQCEFNQLDILQVVFPVRDQIKTAASQCPNYRAHKCLSPDFIFLCCWARLVPTWVTTPSCGANWYRIKVCSAQFQFENPHTHILDIRWLKVFMSQRWFMQIKAIVQALNSNTFKNLAKWNIEVSKIFTFCAVPDCGADSLGLDPTSDKKLAQSSSDFFFCFASSSWAFALVGVFTSSCGLSASLAPPTSSSLSSTFSNLFFLFL